MYRPSDDSSQASLMMAKPCSLQDFMEYLVYVTHDAENLQFYLWLKDYSLRFEAAPESDRVLSPPWNPIDAAPHAKNVENQNAKTSDQTLASSGHGETCLDGGEDITDANHSSKRPLSSSMLDSVHFNESNVAGANTKNSLKWSAFTVQPFRTEMTRIMSHYITPGSPRELNLSYKDREAVLHAVQHTTHPSAFNAITGMIELTIRNQSHPNFIRWSICNGNKPRVFFLKSLAVFNITCGFLIAVFLTLSSVSRWYRIVAAIWWYLGITNLIAAYKGLCVLLHRLHTRNMRPWEMDEEKDNPNYMRDDDEATLAGSDVYNMHTPPKSQIDVFGEANNYEKAPWVEKYHKRSFYRKLFEKTIRVHDQALRLMQARIILQAEIYSVLITVPLTVAFVALPSGNYY